MLSSSNPSTATVNAMAPWRWGGNGARLVVSRFEVDQSCPVGIDIGVPLRPLQPRSRLRATCWRHLEVTWIWVLARDCQHFATAIR